MNTRCLIFSGVLVTLSSSDSSPKLPEPVTYFPTSVGIKLVYVFDNKTENAETLTVMKVDENENGLVITEGNITPSGTFPGRRIFVCKEGVAVLNNGGTVAEWLLKAPYTDGTKWETSRMALGKTTIESVAIKGEEEVEVPAGKFKAIRVDCSLTIAGKDSKWSYWYAKDLGVVKEVDVSNHETVLQSVSKK